MDRIARKNLNGGTAFNRLEEKISVQEAVKVSDNRSSIHEFEKINKRKDTGAKKRRAFHS